jgi:hypothetical protein
MPKFPHPTQRTAMAMTHHRESLISTIEYPFVAVLGDASRMATGAGGASGRMVFVVLRSALKWAPGGSRTSSTPSAFEVELVLDPPGDDRR